MFKSWQKNSPTLGDLMLYLLVEDLSPFLRNRQNAPLLFPRREQFSQLVRRCSVVVFIQGAGVGCRY